MTAHNETSEGKRSSPNRSAVFLTPAAIGVRLPHPLQQPCLRGRQMDEPLIAEAGVRQSVRLLHPPQDGARTFADGLFKLFAWHELPEKVPHFCSSIPP